MISSTIIPARASVPGGAPRRLVIYFNGTFMNRENGAHVRVLELIHWARRQFPGLIVYSYIDHYSCPWTQKEIRLFCQEFPDVELRLDRRTRLLGLLTRLKNVVCTLAPRLTSVVLALHVPRAATAFEEIRRNAAGYLLLVNYVEAFAELNGVSPESFTVIETHDVKFLNFAKKASRSLADLRVVGKFRSEVVILERADALIAIAPPEVGMFRLWLPGKKIFYIPRYPAKALDLPSAPPYNTFLYDLLFVGSRNPFNLKGLEQLFEKHGTWLARFRVAVAGQICLEAAAMRIARDYPNVFLRGYVADLRDLYRASKIVICPVEGTGLKIKVIEALAMGKPVIGSQHALDGLPPGYEKSVFLLSEAIAIRLIDNDECRRAAENAAKLYAATLDAAGDVNALQTFIADRLQGKCA